MQTKGVLTIISGFSGAGKGTIVKELLKNYDNYALSISAATRDPRPGEENGVHYFFMTKEEFEGLIAENALLEYASYNGNYYGTPRRYVEDMLSKGKDVILEIEMQGARKVRSKIPEALMIFVTPPSIAELKARLINRGTESMEVIESRMNIAKEEAKGIEEYDYLLINDKLEESVEKLHLLIQNAHLRPACQETFIEGLRTDLMK